MSITNYQVEGFIPELWAAELLISKEKNLVYGAVANRKYEGLIRDQGDRVRISQVGDIAINTYTKNSTSSLTVQYLDDAQIYLDIDQAKSFAFRVDDIDLAQTNIPFMQEAMRKASYRLNDYMDQYIAGLYGGAGISQNSSSSPVDMTSTNVELEFLTVGQSLDENNAPRQGRFAIIPPWVQSKLYLARILTDTDNSKLYDEGMLAQMKANGFIGSALGFDFYMSNNVHKDSTAWADSKIICGVMGESFSLAEQIVKVETYRQTSEGFGDVVKGLHVYGAKIIQPNLTACIFADYTAES